MKKPSLGNTLWQREMCCKQKRKREKKASWCEKVIRVSAKVPPGVTSAKSVKQIVERLLFLCGLELPMVPPTLHQNRVLQLARKWSKYQIQPLLKFKAERRHALLVAHLFEQTLQA